jgi:hypothetical protein
VRGHRLLDKKALILAALLHEHAALGVEGPSDSDAARPCRPTVSCTADITAPGSLEAEVGALYSKLGSDGRAWAYPVLLKQTFTPLLQIQVGSNGYTVLHSAPGVPAARRIDNLVVGPKLHLLDQGFIAPSIALSAQASLPVFATGNDAAFFTGHASKDLGPVHIDWNVGLDIWWGDGGNSAVTQPFTALALSASPLPPFGLALEGYAFASAQPYAPRDGGVRAAITSTPRPWMVFDFGGDVGWFPSTRAFSLFVGMTLVPVIFWRAPQHAP